MWLATCHTSSGCLRGVLGTLQPWSDAFHGVSDCVRKRAVTLHEMADGYHDESGSHLDRSDRHRNSSDAYQHASECLQATSETHQVWLTLPTTCRAPAKAGRWTHQGAAVSSHEVSASHQGRSVTQRCSGSRQACSPFYRSGGHQPWTPVGRKLTLGRGWYQTCCARYICRYCNNLARLLAGCDHMMPSLRA